MYKRLKVKLYPTKNQIEMLENHFDGYRFAYNLSLEYKQHLYKYYKINISGFDLQKELLQIRKEIEWLSECKAECIREAGLVVDTAYKNFYSGRGFPKFKSKKGVQSFIAKQSIKCNSNKLSFYKNKIKFKTSEHYNQLLEMHKIKQCAFKRDSCGDYWATLLIETEDTKILPNSENIVGIDLYKNYKQLYQKI